MISKAYATIAAQVVAHGEVSRRIRAASAVNSYGQFEYQLDNGAAANPEDIQLARLSKFISRNAKDARKIVGILLGAETGNKIEWPIQKIGIFPWKNPGRAFARALPP